LGAMDETGRAAVRRCTAGLLLTLALGAGFDLAGFAPAAHAYEETKRPAAAADTAATPVTPDRAARADAARRAAEAVRHPKRLAYDLIRFRQNVTIHADEKVDHDVVMFGGDLRVDGEIDGGAIVIGGNIVAGPRAHVQREAVAVAGRVDAAPGATLDSGALSLSIPATPYFAHWGGPGAGRFGELLGDSSKAALLLLVALPLAAVFPRRLERARATFDAAPAKCLGLGLVAIPGGVFTAVIVSFLLALSLAGLPLALVLLIAASCVALVSLWIGTAAVGGRACAWLRRQQPSTRRRIVVGILCLRAPELASDLVRVVSPENRLAAGFETLDVVLTLAALSGGLGAIVLLRWNAAARREEEATA